MVDQRDQLMRDALALFLAKLDVYYAYRTYSIHPLGVPNNVPDGAIFLPMVDVKLHALVPNRRYNRQV